MREGLPPGPRLPVALQTLLWFGWPVGFMERCGGRYGELFTLRLALGPPIVMVTSPGLADRVLSLPPEVATAGEENAVLEPLLGSSSLLMLDGPEHLRHRRLMLPFFHGERMRRHAPAIAAITAAEVRRWPVGRPFPLLPAMRSITLDVILRVVMGIEESARLAELRTLVARLLRMGSSWMVLPSMRRDYGPLSPWGRFVRLRGRVRGLLREEIDDRRNPAGGGADDVIGALVSHLTDDELTDELLTLLVAGYETTATSLAWTWELLLRRPDVLERVRAGSDADSPALLGAVIREALRLRPVFRFVSRRLRSPLELGGYRLPAGTSVGANVYLTHRRPDTYPEPALLVPERFLRRTPEPGTWIPFGGGVHRCLGASFAVFEMEVVLRTVLGMARLRPASPRPEPVRLHAVTMVPGRGARAVVLELGDPTG